jgi:NAD kinase
MKLSQLTQIFLIFLSFNTIYCNDQSGVEIEISENIEDQQIIKSFVDGSDIDKTWGAINNDSVRIGM